MSLSRFLYVPNLIGYTRVILSFVAYHYSSTNPYVFAVCYFLSQFLDMFDGMAARAFNQSTKFGAMLDMVTDRCSTIGLMLTIAQRKPELTLYCHFFIWLDICSHWCHMLAKLGHGDASHKLVNSGPKILQFYYRVHWFMVLLIVGAEGFPVCYYLTTFKEVADIFDPYLTYLMYFYLPLFALKHIINVIQFMYASYMLDENTQTNSSRATPRKVQ